jgi:hypothetical protein
MFFRRQAPVVGAGWLGQAAGLLEGTPESGMHAWLHLFAGMSAVFDHRMVDGLAHADRAIAVAREHGNADVQYMATSFKGYGEMHQGNLSEGLAFLDEAAAAATSGQLGLRVASDILVQHDRRLSEHRRPEARGPVGGRGRALDAPSGTRAAIRASAGSTERS